MHISNIYTSLRTREKNIYAIQGTKISEGGISTLFLQVYFSLLVLFLIIGVIIVLITGQMLFIPIQNGEFNPLFLVFVFGTPLFLSWALINTQIQGYRTINFIVAFLKPKNIVNHKLNKSTFTKVKNDTLIENIFF